MNITTLCYSGLQTQTSNPLLLQRFHYRFWCIEPKVSLKDFWSMANSRNKTSTTICNLHFPSNKLVEANNFSLILPGSFSIPQPNANFSGTNYSIASTCLFPYEWITSNLNEWSSSKLIIHFLNILCSPLYRFISNCWNLEMLTGDDAIIQLHQ